MKQFSYTKQKLVTAVIFLCSQQHSISYTFLDNKWQYDLRTFTQSSIKQNIICISYLVIFVLHK